MMSASDGASRKLHSVPRAMNSAPPSRASKHRGADENVVNSAAPAELPAARVAKASATTATAIQPPIYFTVDFILERARKTDAKLKLPGTAVKPVRTDRNTIVEP